MPYSFGIQNYDPVELLTTEAIADACRLIADQAVRKPLTASWTAWDEERDEWIDYMPVVLTIGSINYEIDWRMEDRCALSRDSIDVKQPLHVCNAEESPTRSKENALPELRCVVGKTVTRIDFYEINAFEVWLPGGIAFVFDDVALYVYNTIDANGVTNEQLPEEWYRRVGSFM